MAWQTLWDKQSLAGAFMNAWMRVASLAYFFSLMSVFEYSSDSGMVLSFVTKANLLEAAAPSLKMDCSMTLEISSNETDPFRWMNPYQRCQVTLPVLPLFSRSFCHFNPLRSMFAERRDERKLPVRTAPFTICIRGISSSCRRKTYMCARTCQS